MLWPFARTGGKRGRRAFLCAGHRKHCKYRCGRGVAGARLRAVGAQNNDWLPCSLLMFRNFTHRKDTLGIKTFVCLCDGIRCPLRASCFWTKNKWTHNSGLGPRFKHGWLVLADTQRNHNMWAPFWERPLWNPLEESTCSSGGMPRNWKQRCSIPVEITEHRHVVDMRAPGFLCDPMHWAYDYLGVSVPSTKSEGNVPILTFFGPVFGHIAAASRDLLGSGITRLGPAKPQ